jgi:hypothetical protein
MAGFKTSWKDSSIDSRLKVPRCPKNIPAPSVNTSQASWPADQDSEGNWSLIRRRSAFHAARDHRGERSITDRLASPHR